MKYILPVLAVLIMACSNPLPPGIANSPLKDLKGPADTTDIPPEDKEEWSGFSQGPANAIAVLLTDPESSWLGLVHGFKTMGLPFFLTRDIGEALKHKVIFVYPYISGNVLSEENLHDLESHVKQGGALWSGPVLGGGLQGLFGFDSTSESKDRKRLVLTRNDITAFLGDPAEISFAFSGSATGGVIGSYAFTGAKSTVLFEYEDSGAAIIYKQAGKGSVLAFGFDLGFVLQRVYGSRTDGLSQAYVNAYAPGVDSLLRLLEDQYRKQEPLAVVIARTPAQYPLAVMMTHDVDYSQSYVNAPAYADMEKANSVKATYFIQTKYLKDYQDVAIMTPETISAIRYLEDSDMEIASHSVSHSRQFSDFDLGTGEEYFPAYRPRIVDDKTTTGGSILGELRVSKFLLENMGPGISVVSFRPGYLSYPYALPQALEAVGYLYDSSVTADSTLTHMPFRLNYNRDYASQTGVFEFPITIEDEQAPQMDQRLDAALAIAEKIAAYNGIFTVLIHPNVLDHKFRFEEGFIKKTRDSYWYGTMKEFGSWWSDRDQIVMEVSQDGDGMTINLKAENGFSDIGLFVPAGMQPDPAKNPDVLVQNTRVVIPGKHTEYTLELVSP